MLWHSPNLNCWRRRRYDGPYWWSSDAYRIPEILGQVSEAQKQKGQAHGTVVYYTIDLRMFVFQNLHSPVPVEIFQKDIPSGNRARSITWKKLRNMRDGPPQDYGR